MSMNNQEETKPTQVSKPDEILNESTTPGTDGSTVPVVVKNANAVEETIPIKMEPQLQPSDVEATTPVLISDSVDKGGMEPPKKGNKTGKPRSKRWAWVLGGIALLLVLGGIGAWLGYLQGIQMRLGQESSQIAMSAVTQFQLGLEDENAGRLEMARKRYEYVVRLDPNFPGVQERLTTVMLHMAETAVPTEIPTATSIPVTATPDTRGIEEKFSTAISYLRANEWDNTISTLELIRKEDIHYRSVDVDGMLYISLRFRGIQKILSGSLEPGIYDLTLSELFAPLDKEADSYRSWARYYLTGSAFWEIDWAKVVEIFGEIYPYLPNLRDGSGWTAQERYRIGAKHYGDQLAAEGRWCDARYYYDQALSLAGDENLAPTATAVYLLCEPPTPTPTITPEVTATPEITPSATEEDLTGLCCPPDPENPDDPRCADYVCPGS